MFLDIFTIKKFATQNENDKHMKIKDKLLFMNVRV